jgi:hypothetical protein
MSFNTRILILATFCTLIFIGCPKKASIETIPLRTEDWEVVPCQGVIWSGKPVDGKTTTECYYDNVWRSASVLTECPGADKSGALCYPNCREGYTGVAFVCWENCPPGYHDDGAFCRKDVDIISSNNDACPWYNKCGLGLRCSICPEGYGNDGCTCRRDADIFAKKTYTRGPGYPMSCPPDKEKIGGLCYGNCAPGFHADGIYCVADKQTCRDVPVTEPADYTKLQQYCFMSQLPNECRTISLIADSADHGKQSAQGCCENCEVTQIDCSTVSTACPPPF